MTVKTTERLGVNRACSRYLNQIGEPSPRTCRACGLGPCKNVLAHPKTTDERHVCDYPTCSVRGSGHPLACGCRSASAAPAPERAAEKIAAGLREAVRVKRLINAVYAVDGHELTEQEAVEVLARVDAP